VAGVAQGVVGQLGHATVRVNTSWTDPPGNPIKPAPVGPDLARLIVFKQGDPLKAQAGPRLPAQARTDGGYETAAMQKPAISARRSSMNLLPSFMS
jgi:hypothetical protein